ncbi:START domain-containing protein [Aeromonas sobria]|uniref:START domain-containing protein n=1 Tax=Aeromonas sobria TaxID=646 RepID=UPI003D05FE9F
MTRGILRRGAGSLGWLLLSLLPGPGAWAAPDWALVREQGPVRLWARAHPPGPFQALRLEMRVAARPAALLAVLRDTSRHSQWLPGSREVRLLARPTPLEDLVYIRLAAPWPARDRELITRSRLEWLPGCGLRLRVWADADALPPTPGLMRIRASQGLWQATPLGAGESLIRLETYTHPGGQLPGWLVNRVAASSAFESFLAIHSLMPRVNAQAVAVVEANCAKNQ